METATQIQFTYVNKLSGEYATITLPFLYGKLRLDVIEDRQLAYERLANIFGEDFVEYCVLLNFIYKSIEDLH